MRRADESLSVSHEYDQQRRTFRAAVCEERARAADGDRAKRQAVGVLHLNAATPGKQGRVCERSGMEESACEPKCSGDEQSRPISGQPDLMAPAFGVVGGTPGWAVREIISISICAHVACENRLNWDVRIHFFSGYGLTIIFCETSKCIENIWILTHNY